MARQLLVVGLEPGTTPEHAMVIRDQLRDRYPGLEVAVIAGCTSVAVVELPEGAA